jgi:hypothetical protein
MRDERNLQRPAGSREAEEALSAYVAARTSALIFFHLSGAVTIGSATNIRLDNHFFLATATHNIDNLDRGAELKVIPYTAASAEKITVISRSHPRASRPDHDVAWLQVAPSIAEDSNISWISMNDLLSGQRFDPYDAFFIQGYPASEVVVQGPRLFDLLSLGIGCIPLPPDRGEDFLTLEYPPQSPEDFGVDWPNPEGLSDGGGVWTIPSFSDTRIWTPDATRLIGIGKSYEPQRARLSTTPIECWLSVVSQDFPEFSGEIEAHLRESHPTPRSLISPHFRHFKLEDPTIDDLVDVLEDRLKYWLLEPAKKQVSNAIEQVAGFNLLLSYFEGIWIFIKGKDSKSHSREFFESAFVDVFRTGGLKESLLQRVARVFYEDAHCGFFHDAMFRGRIFFGKPRDGVIHITLPIKDGAIDENGLTESIIIDVEGFYQYVEGHFGQLIARLRDPNQIELRSNFQAMCHLKWEYEGDPRAIVL